MIIWECQGSPSLIDWLWKTDYLLVTGWEFGGFSRVVFFVERGMRLEIISSSHVPTHLGYGILLRADLQVAKLIQIGCIFFFFWTQSRLDVYFAVCEQEQPSARQNPGKNGLSNLHLSCMERETSDSLAYSAASGSNRRQDIEE